MTPLPFATYPGPRPPWTQPPVVDAAGHIVVATGSVDARDGLAWIGSGGRLDGTYLLPEGVRIGSGPLAAPSGPPLAPVLSAGRAFLAATFEAGQGGSSGGDEPAVTSPGRGTLTGTAGKARTEALVAIEPGGPVAGWPLVLPTGAVNNALFVGPDGTIIVLASGPGETVAILAADPTATGVGK